MVTNSATKNKYLLIDYGNSLIKAAIYNPKTDKIEEYMSVDNDKSLSDLLAKSKKIRSSKIEKIFFTATPSIEKTKPFEDDLTKKFKLQVWKINKTNFEDVIDFSNLEHDLVIAGDILLQAYYGIKVYKSALIFSLGTVYVGIAVANKQFQSVYLLPSLSRGLKDVSNITSIDKNSIPKTYDKLVGFNTIDNFASGANTNMYGWIEAISKGFGIKNILITGGDCHYFQLLSKHYKVIDNLVLKALALLIKEKCW